MHNVRTIAQPFLLDRPNKKNTSKEFTAENKIKWWRGGFVSAPAVVSTVFTKIQN
jgi:hypothetical protein